MAVSKSPRPTRLISSSTRVAQFQQRVTLAIVMSLCAVAGTYVVVRSFAATPVPPVGDINKDGVVNVFDLSQLLSLWGGNSTAADLKPDGKVDVFDLSVLLSNWGKTTSGTPLPTATPAPTPAPTIKPTATPVPTPVPTVKPTATPVPTAYCGGKTPCYGPADLAAHATLSNCWGFNKDWVIDLTKYAPKHPAGTNRVVASSTCGKDIAGALAGSVSVSGTHNHNSSTKGNTASSQLTTFRIGYYDATKK